MGIDFFLNFERNQLLAWDRVYRWHKFMWLNSHIIYCSEVRSVYIHSINSQILRIWDICIYHRFPVTLWTYCPRDHGLKWSHQIPVALEMANKSHFPRWICLSYRVYNIRFLYTWELSVPFRICNHSLHKFPANTISLNIPSHSCPSCSVQHYLIFHANLINMLSLFKTIPELKKTEYVHCHLTKPLPTASVSFDQKGKIDIIFNTDRYFQLQVSI